METEVRSNRPVVVITGAGSGIGRATARLADRAGWSGVLIGRRSGPLEATAASLKGRWLALPADVSDPHAVAAVIERTLESFGRIDALVNNAAIAPAVPIDQETPEGVRRVLEINTLGPVHTLLAVWPVFKRQRAGCLVNISSMATGDPFPGFLAYGASKGALEVMVRSCANEGREHGIRAFGVSPGAVETEMLRAIIDEQIIPSHATLDPEDVARVIVACLLGERDDEVGRTIPVPGPVN